MASHSRSTSALGLSGASFAAGGASRESKTYFEQQREALIGEIAMSFEQVLANINKLNRSLEAIIAVGNEFSSVEALWSQFENVLAKDEDQPKTEAADAAAEEHEHEQEEHRDDGRGSPTPKPKAERS